MSSVRAIFAVAILAAVGACSPQAPTPAAPAAPGAPTPTSGPVEIEVPLEADHGTFLVPATLNNTLQVKATLDSGASDVVLPAQVAEQLVRSGTVGRDDYIGDRTYILADGSRVPSRVINLRSLKVGTLELANVRAAVGGAGSSLLLGQSFLSRLTNWSIDNRRHVLVLRDTLDTHDRITVAERRPGVAPPTTTILNPDGTKPGAGPQGEDKPFAAGAGDERPDTSGDDESEARPTKPGYGGKPTSGDGGKKW